MVRLARCALLPVVAALLGPAVSSPEARVPPLLNYQGSLRTAADSPVNGPVDITFSIYSAQTGGAPLWSERHTITVAGGRFHVLLGSLVPFPEGLFSENNRYLALKVDGGDEFQPRQRIVSVAYALRAARADDVPGRAISPESVVLAGGKALWDTAGVLTAPQVIAGSLAVPAAGTVVDAGGNWTGGRVTAPQVATDSLAVGGRGVIDRAGNWVGPPVPVKAAGMGVDTLIVRKALQDTLSFGSPGRWQDIDGSTEDLTAFVNLKRSALLDIQFTGTAVTGGWPFESRIAIRTGSRQPIIAGNTSGFPGGAWGTLSNAAVLSLEPGLHKVYIEGRTSASARVTGTLVIRVYAR